MVIIIGAGISGLSAALRLLKKDKNVKILILEARKRVGGRTETIDILGNKIDIGGQWIGSKHTELLNYVKEFNLELIEQYYPLKDTVKTHRLVECLGYEDLDLDIFSKNDIIDFLNFIDEIKIDINEPWKHENAEKWDNMSVKDIVEDTYKNVDSKREICLFVQTLLASNAENISFLYFIFYVKSGGGIIYTGDGEEGAQKWKLKEGMQTVSEMILIELLKNGVEIIYESVVCDIICNFNNFDDEVKVVDKSGRVFYSDKIIVAISPKLLTGINIFPLQEEKIILYKNYFMGSASKIIVVYNTLNISKIKEHILDHGIIHNLYYSSIIIDNIVKPALVGLITGNFSDLFNKMTKDERKNIVMKQLQDITKEEPIYYIEKTWNEEFSGGCYSGILGPNGTFYKYGKYIRESLYSKIFFASTETSIEFCGYIEGAIRSGIRAADEILE